jgi:hypothetical protein
MTKYLLLGLLLLAGCKECVESHTAYVCRPGYFYYISVWNGNSFNLIPIWQPEECGNTAVCDRWEK